MSNFLAIAALAGFGALIPEVLKVITSLRAHRIPRPPEILASVLLVLLSAVGVTLLFHTDGVSPLQLAVSGAAFPQTFSSAVAAATRPPRATRGLADQRRLRDWLAWRVA